MGIIHSIHSCEPFPKWLGGLLEKAEPGVCIDLPGIDESAHGFCAALIASSEKFDAIVVVVDGLRTQERMLQELQTWLAPAKPCDHSLPILFFPSWEVLPHQPQVPHVDVISDRLAALISLRAGSKKPPIVLTSASSLTQKTFSPSALQARLKTLKPGDIIDPLDLVEWLETQGYEPESKVTQKGEIALHGGILDLFSPTAQMPVRIEFFGNQIESLRFFDPSTQISTHPIKIVEVPPAGELTFLRRNNFSDEAGLIFDYLPKKTAVIILGPESVVHHVEAEQASVPPGQPGIVRWNELTDLLGERQYFRFDIRPDDQEQWMLEANLAPVPTFQNLEAFRPLAQLSDPQIAEQQRRAFFQQIERWIRQKYLVTVFCSTDGEQQRFEELWNDYQSATADARGKTTCPPTVLGILGRGFLCDLANLAVVTDAEIFGRSKMWRPRRLKMAHEGRRRHALEMNFTEFREGDYVVHLQYGIAKFLGLHTAPAGEGRKASDTSVVTQGQESLALEFAPNNHGEAAPRLYVPVSEAHLVSKYIGAGRERPHLDTLTGKRWAKAKAQSELAIRDFAAQMLSVQAARDAQPGFSHPTDTTWQREFENSFPYEETPDQVRAISETKADMERARPMDRLICGDVGFGKTEVAIRGAFKAVMSGKQVAILVPTTVLAQQHANHFQERMAGYPIRVELLSRYKTKKEQRQVIAALAQGSVDIVIGTHRLLQSDVLFKDLGLVVIDEEQRFGVMHKERFKMLRQLVDVLTLSATPIPRTLHLALTGARDMSTIETPPQDRLPVETVIAAYDERLIRDAIQRELNRDGQVFFLHNRVGDIDAVAQKIRMLVPEARIVVGHGQMDADELEEVMTRFVNGEADILVSTTIIESGIDIPNANTIIIDRADRFGLSDLYQLRGRVGRYKHQAYAYLLIPRHAGLLADARKRISAVKQYSTLGSGFKIAMRDLELRGAGNILGPEQSGHIAAIGFELYCQLLKQSVAILKGEKVQARIDVHLRLDFLQLTVGHSISAPQKTPKESAPAEDEFQIDVPRAVASGWSSAEPEEVEPVHVDYAFLPLGYISEPQQRVEIYRRLAQLSTKKDLTALEGELRDRFGNPPESVVLLLKASEIKLIASDKQVSQIETKQNKLMLTRHGDFVMVGGKFPRLTGKTTNARLKEIKRLLLAIA